MQTTRNAQTNQIKTKQNKQTTNSNNNNKRKALFQNIDTTLSTP